MKKFTLIFLIIGLLLFILPFFSAAHYIVGFANNAIDGTFANDHTVILWNSLNGISDNKTDLIGTSGNSQTDNIYMIDCMNIHDPTSRGYEKISWNEIRVFNSPQWRVDYRIGDHIELRNAGM